MKFNRYRISDKKILKYYQKLKKRLYKVEKDACTYMEEQKKAKHYRGMCQKYNEKVLNLQSKLEFESLCNNLWVKEYCQQYYEKKELKKLLKKYEKIAIFSIVLLMTTNIIMLMMI